MKQKITKMQIYRQTMSDYQFKKIMNLIGDCISAGGSVDYVEKTVPHREQPKTLMEVRTDIEIRWKK